MIALLAALAPALASKLFGERGEAIAAKAVEIAKSVAGVDDGKAALEAIKADGALTLQFQQALMPLHIAELEADTKRLAEINATIRAEIASEDSFIRRMRPFFGYTLAIQLLALSLAIIYAAIWAPTTLSAITEVVEALVPIFEFALAVLGIYVYRRSGEKNAKAGVPPMLDGVTRLASAIRSK